MKYLQRRLIALVLAMTMSLSLFCVNAWATEAETVTAEDGSTAVQDCVELPPEGEDSTDESNMSLLEESSEDESASVDNTIEEMDSSDDESAGGSVSSEEAEIAGNISEEETGEVSQTEQDTPQEESVEEAFEQCDIREEEEEEPGLEPMGSTMTSATSISLGSTYSGAITNTTDKNYYKFTMSKSGRIRLVATANIRSIYYRIYNSSGEQLWYDYYYWNETTEQIATDENIDFTSGTYYFCVEKRNNSTGTYSFSLNHQDAEESFAEADGGSNNSISNASSVAFGNNYNGQIAINDEKDFYRFTLNQSGRINLIATAKMSQIYYRIYSTSGEELWYNYYYWNETTEQIATDENIDLTSGTYFFCVEKKNSKTGNYSFSLRYTSAEESFAETDGGSDNLINTANSITTGSRYNGQIAINDGKDFYRFNLNKSGRINLIATAELSQIYYKIYSASGEELWYDSYYWNETTKKIVTNENIVLDSGTYYLCVEKRNGHTGPYSFSLTQKSAPIIENASITLSQTWYTFDGYRKEPSVTVKLNGEVLSYGNDYWVDYSNNVNAGTATVTITGTGEYSGTATKTFSIGKASGYVSASNVNKTCSKNKQSFYLSAWGSSGLSFKSNNKNITVNKNNGLVTIKKQYAGKAVITITASENGNYTAASKKITVKVMPSKTNLYGVYSDVGGKIGVSWYWNGTGKGYQIQYSMDKKFKKGNKTKTIKGNNTTYTTIGKLKKGKKYFVRIRTVNGKHYSGWSKAKSVKTSKK